MAALCPYCLSEEQCLNAGIGALLKFSRQADVLGGHISAKHLPLPHRWEECQGRWCFTPGWWQHVLFYLPMPYSFQNIKRNQGELMHPEKCWASAEARFLQLPENEECQSPLRSFTSVAGAPLGFTQSCLLCGTSWGNPSGGIRAVYSSPLFLGHVLGASPWPVMLHHFTTWVMGMFNANSVGGRRPVV